MTPPATPPNHANVPADQAKVAADQTVLAADQAAVVAENAVLAADQATLAADQAAPVTPVSAVPPAPKITLTSPALLAFSIPAATPVVTGANVWVNGVKVLWSNWQNGVPTSIDLTKSVNATTWGGTLPTFTAGVAVSVQITVYSNFGESAESTAVSVVPIPSVVITPPPPPPPPPPPSGTAYLGMYVQDAPGSDAAISSHIAAMGKPKIVQQHQFYANVGSWAAQGDISWLLSDIKGSIFPKLLITLGLLPQGGSFSDSASQTACGKSWGGQLAAAGYNASNCVVRLGHECNVDQEDPWSAKENPPGFSKAFATTVAGARSAGFTGLINWNTSPCQGWDISTCMPPTSSFDIIGIDPYPQSWAFATNNQPTNSQAIFDQTRTAQFDGLDVMAALGKKINKPLAIDEYSGFFRADGHGTGDDPLNLTNFSSWVKANNVLYVNFFESDQNGDGENDLTDGKFPNMLAAFKKAFGS